MVAPIDLVPPIGAGHAATIATGTTQRVALPTRAASTTTARADQNTIRQRARPRRATTRRHPHV